MRDHRSKRVHVTPENPVSRAISLATDFQEQPQHCPAAADFRTSTYESNLKLIGDVWDSVEFLKALPEEMRISWAKYPQTVNCVKN